MGPLFRLPYYMVLGGWSGVFEALTRFRWWHVTWCGADWATFLDTPLCWPILHCSPPMPAGVEGQSTLVLDSALWTVTQACFPLVEALQPSHSGRCLKKSDTNGPMKNWLCAPNTAPPSPVMATWGSSGIGGLLMSGETKAQSAVSNPH